MPRAAPAAPPAPARVLLLPGWQNSGPGHWQSLWQAAHGDHRVQQSDWFWPRRGDWMSQLEEAVLASERPALLAAHSLGCHLVAAWAAHSQHTARVLGALLVAPPDLSVQALPPQLAAWVPPVRQPLPFPSRLVFSSNDPFATAAASRGLADAWGAVATEAGPLGHLNAESGLDAWPEARAWLFEFSMPVGRST